MANNDTQAVYKAYINNKQRELVRLGFGEVLDIEDEEQVLAVLKGVSDVSELVGIATTNNSAESILKMKHLTYNEVLVGRAQDDYNSDYDARVAEINKLRIQQSSQEIAKGVSNEPEVPQPTDELELKKNDMLENMFANNVLFNNLGSNNQLEDDDDDNLVDEDEYDYSAETDSNTDSNLSMFDEEEELEDEEPDYSEDTNLDIFDEPEDEDEDEEVDYSDEDEDSTDLSLFDDEDEDEDEEVDYSAEDEDEDTSENLSFFDEDEEDEDEEIDYSAEDEEFEDDNLDMFDDDEDGDGDEEYDYSEGDSDSEEDLSMFDEDEEEDEEDEYTDEEDDDDDSDADISIFDDEDEDDDVIEVKTEPKPSTTSNVTPITSTPQRNVQPKSKPVQRRKLDASDRAFLGIVNNGLNIVAKTQKYIKGERK